MATVTILPHLDSGGTTPLLSTGWTAHGTADFGDALRTSGDGKYAAGTTGQALAYTLADTGALPDTALISSVAFNVRHKTDGAGTGEIDPQIAWYPYGALSAIVGGKQAWDSPNGSGQLTSAAYTTWTVTSTTVPTLGVAWTKALLFAAGTGPWHPFNFVGGGANEYDLDLVSVVVTYNIQWWKLILPTMTLYFQGSQPSAYTLGFDVFSGGVFYPTGTTFTWVTTTAPTDKGWWVSSDLFAGAGYMVNNDSRPKAPRGYTEVTSLATGATAWAGGTACVVFNNHLVYAEGGYTVGTTSPSIRIYDGLTDRPIAALPNTSAGAVPKAIIGMLTANGVVYVATLDSGTSSADWVGRVFALDIESGQLTPMGTAFPSGHVPYALCWHAGRLWCGTHRQSTAASGKVFYIRPGIDTDWTADYDLATSTVSSATSLLSFQGKLYVGTNNAAAAFAKILVRDTAGAYTTSLTLSGGTAAAGNGVPAMVEYGSAIYASYYNADTPVVATIRKYDGSSWTTPYTGSGTTLVPFVALPIDGTTMFAVGGGAGISAVLLKTADGTTWTDQSAFLQQSSPASSGLPACGTIVH